MSESQRSLPLGRSTFATLRIRNDLYVDKTAYVHRLAREDAKIFLVRPRRFGKSLLLSTFESLFRDGLTHFRGLAIEKLWSDRTYPVVKLDFSEVKEFSDVEEFRSKFYEKLAAAFGDVGFRVQTDGFSVLTQLSTFLASLPPAGLVVLIDEYDAPLTQCLDNPKLFREVRSVMSELFLSLKSREGCLRFFFMTGITKFSNTSIFSAFNNLQDISLDPLYGALLGYTDEEIRANFSEYLVPAAEALHMDQEELMAELKKNYDGFSFDERAETRVYCPWSVLSFLNRPDRGFMNYWFESGGQPTVLLKYLQGHGLQSPDSYGKSITYSLRRLNASRQYDEIDLEALLFQSGYLTVKSVEGGDFVELNYPNEEVVVSMAQLYAENMIRKERIAQSGIARLKNDMSYGSLDEVVTSFNRVLDNVDYHDSPICNEGSCRTHLQILMIGLALLPRVEVHNAKGRSDMEVETSTRHWVFEFKFAHRDEEAPALLEKAVEQMTDCRYGMGYLGDKSLLRAALVFSAESRAFVAWRLVEES